MNMLMRCKGYPQDWCLSSALRHSLLWLAPGLLGQTLTTTQTVAVNIAPAAKIVSVQPSLTLVAGGGPFAGFSGSETISLRVRSAPASSTSLRMQVTGDFSPSGGPSVAAGHLTYTCSTGYGTPCTSTTAQTTT